MLALYPDAPVDGSARLKGDCEKRGFCGDVSGDIPQFVRSCLCNRTSATHRKDNIGFRLVTDHGLH